MGTFVSSLAAIIIILPILFFYIVYVIVRKWTANPKKARNVAINSTTIILIFSVHFMIMAIWSKSLLTIIFLFMLVIAIIFTFIYWKLQQEIIYRKVFIGYWRLNFLIFFSAYIVLLLYGTISRAVHAVTGT